MNAKDSPSFDDHEHIAFIDDDVSGLRAIIAVHNTTLGPAVGGCRMYPYQSEAQALEDVLRLSRGMTYKSALAGLPMGGGKAVIIGDPAKHKSPELFAKMGEFIDSLNGLYVSAEDSGTSVSDLKQIATCTDHVLGINDAQKFGGDPSPLTALGVFCGIKAAVEFQFNGDSLLGKTIAVQGAGAVGQHLIKSLIKAGAEVLVSDVSQQNLSAAKSLGAQVCAVNEILSVKCDVFAPCAMGAILDENTISNLTAKVVAGGANNQLAQAHHADLLHKKGVLYAPDYVINAGGIIEIHRQFCGGSEDQTVFKIEAIADTLTDIFTLSQSNNKPTSEIADLIAENKFKKTCGDTHLPTSDNSKKVFYAA